MPMRPTNPYASRVPGRVPAMAIPEAPLLGPIGDPARPGHLDPAASAMQSARMAAGAAQLDTMAKRGLTRKADRVSSVFGRDKMPAGREQFLRDKMEKMAGNQGLLGHRFLKRGDY